MMTEEELKKIEERVEPYRMDDDDDDGEGGADAGIWFQPQTGTEIFIALAPNRADGAKIVDLLNTLCAALREAWERIAELEGALALYRAISDAAKEWKRLDELQLLSPSEQWRMRRTMRDAVEELQTAECAAKREANTVSSPACHCGR